MNKFRATVTFSSQEEKGAVIIAFAKDFKPGSKLDLEENVARMEVFFQDEQPPLSLVEAISKCEQVELHYGDAESESVQGSVSSQRHQKKEQSPQSNMNGTLKLEQLAGECASFEQFMAAVEEFLEIDDKPDFFENLVIALNGIEKVTWGNLLKELYRLNVSHTSYDKSKLVRIISTKFSMKSTLFFKEIKEIKKQFDTTSTVIDREKITQKTEKAPDAVKDSEDRKPKSQEETSEESKVAKTPEKDKQQSSDSKKLRMKCMPSIPDFEECLANIDKSKTIEERVKSILEKMGLKKFEVQEQDKMIRFASFTITMPKSKMTSLDKIFDEMKFAQEERMSVTSKFTSLINVFVRKYDPKWQSIQVIIFLSQLREFVL